ncbi:MAG: hypothetical protein ACOYK8_00475 [Alphaproteobacteria bacterium]
MYQILGAKFDETYTSLPIEKALTLGTLAMGRDGKRYIFVLASAAIAAGDCVAISSTFAASGLTTANAATSVKIGVAQTAIASGSYGWVQIYGACSLSVLAACVGDAILYTSATTGALDDASASQVKITGINILATTTPAAVVSAFMSIEPFANR